MRPPFGVARAEADAVADVRQAVGEVMLDCQRETEGLQDALSQVSGFIAAERSSIETFQNLDHITQVHAELSRLFPALADCVRKGFCEPEGIASTVRLVSLRDRLFDPETPQRRSDPKPGEVSLFSD